MPDSPQHPVRWRSIALIMAGALIGAIMITPAGAHFQRNTVHLLNHGNKRFLNDCDQFGVRGDGFQQVLAQATIDASAATAGYSSDGVLGWTDCADLATGAEVKRMSTGLFRVAFPDWWTDPDFPDDLVLAAVTAMAPDASANYVSASDAVGTVLEVETRTGAGVLVDADFHVVVTGWAFGFLGASGASGAEVRGERGEYPSIPRS